MACYVCVVHNPWRAHVMADSHLLGGRPGAVPQNLLNVEACCCSTRPGGHDILGARESYLPGSTLCVHLCI